MPSLSISVPVEYIAYLCEKFGYDTNKLEGESQGSFAKRKFIEQERNAFKAYQINKRAATAAAVQPTDEIVIS